MLRLRRANKNMFLVLEKLHARNISPRVFVCMYTSVQLCALLTMQIVSDIAAEE